MTMPPDPQFRARLALLNQKFAATVAPTMENIRLVLAQCGTAGVTQPPQAALQALHALLHGVAGSAATFGFPVLGQQSRRIEHLVRAVMVGQGSWPPVVPEVQQLLQWAAVDAQASSYPAAYSAAAIDAGQNHCAGQEYSDTHALNNERRASAEGG